MRVGYLVIMIVIWMIIMILSLVYNKQSSYSAKMLDLQVKHWGSNLISDL
jgi:hypothetical protein